MRYIFSLAALLALDVFTLFYAVLTGSTVLMVTSSFGAGVCTAFIITLVIIGEENHGNRSKIQ